MINKLFDKIIKSENQRSFSAKKNILLSFFIKGFGIIISFVLVPLTLNYLKPEEYGVWITLSSLITWINYFDIGLSNGLRNKLAESFANKEVELSKIYISTTLVLLTSLMFVFISIFFIASNFINWAVVLNVEHNMGYEIKNVVSIVFVLFCVQFILKTIGTVLIADQKPALNDLIFVIGNLLTLIFIFVISKFTASSLTYVALVFSIAPVFVLLIVYVVLFKGKYTSIRPSLNFVRFRYSKDLIGLGLQFFIIQIAVALVTYTTTNLLISQLFDNYNVTVYNIAYRYFFATSMVYTIILLPYWSAVTNAYVKDDMIWISNSMSKMIKVFVLSLVLQLFMVLFSNTFYLIWIGDSIKIPFLISVLVAIYVCLYNWNNTFTYFINGIGKIRLQLYITVISALMYIPLAIYLSKCLGVYGILLASCLSLLPTSIFIPIQFYKLISKKSNRCLE